MIHLVSKSNNLIHPVAYLEVLMNRQRTCKEVKIGRRVVRQNIDKNKWMKRVKTRIKDHS